MRIARLSGPYREGSRDLFLTEGEFRRLGRMLSETAVVGGLSVHAVAAIRLLMLTGYRKSELLILRSEDVDLAVNELRLVDSTRVRAQSRCRQRHPGCLQSCRGLSAILG